MKPLFGVGGGTRNMTGKVGADTGCVDHPNATGGAETSPQWVVVPRP